MNNLLTVFVVTCNALYIYNKKQHKKETETHIQIIRNILFKWNRIKCHTGIFENSLSMMHNKLYFDESGK